MVKRVLTITVNRGIMLIITIRFPLIEDTNIISFFKSKKNVREE